MKYDKDLLTSYQNLLENTNLIDAYLEFHRLFDNLKNDLLKELPDFSLINTSEKILNTYFMLDNEKLRKLNLKLAIYFDYHYFNFKILLLSLDDKKDYYRSLFIKSSYALGTSEDEYIVKVSFNQDDIYNYSKLIKDMKRIIIDLVNFL